MIRSLIGDCRDVLKALPAESVHCVVTSPPYFGLRDYGTATWEGGEDGCSHEPPQEWIDHNFNANSGFGEKPKTQSAAAKSRWYIDGACRCGARRIDAQIGLEPTPEAYVAEMVAVFREVRRVLRRDGTLWLNLGDSYVSTPPGNKTRSPTDVDGSYQRRMDRQLGHGEDASAIYAKAKNSGLKPKDLIGIPWRVAFALQADGWVLRQEIVWAKPNPMPESVTDRCTKAHEQIFLFAKAKWSGLTPRRYAHISSEDARWLALFFDTEGNLCLRREASKDAHYGAHSAQIVLANSNRPLLETAANIVGEGSILERSGVNAPMYYWQVAGKKAADLLSIIYPHLIVKQRQARCLLHLETLKEYRGGHERLATNAIEYRDRLWRAVKELNHFGNPDISWVPEPVFGRWSDCERYFYDAAAIAEPFADERMGNPNGGGQYAKEAYGRPDAQSGLQKGEWNMDGSKQTRNRRSVWTVPSAPFSEAHFATFPPALIEPCILAGCPAKVCAKCGAPWVRETERTFVPTQNPDFPKAGQKGLDASNGWGEVPRGRILSETKGFAPSCRCNAETVPGVVLDPFAGAGTTGLVADRLQRDAILIELNPAYATMARERISDDAGLFAAVAAE